jgi:hypothetical protein
MFPGEAAPESRKVAIGTLGGGLFGAWACLLSPLLRAGRSVFVLKKNR